MIVNFQQHSFELSSREFAKFISVKINKLKE